MMMRRVGTGVPVTPPETPRQPFGTACLRSLLSTSLARYARRLGPHTKLFGLDALLPRSLLPSRPTGSGTPPLRGGVWGHPRRGRAPRSASPLDGGPVSWRTPCEPRCPDCVRGASPPKLDRPVGGPISAGAEIRAWLPPAPRRGLVVPGLDDLAPTSRAPAASGAVLRWLYLAILASLRRGVPFQCRWH